MKKLFSSPKRAVISICALVAILAVLGVGVVFAWNWAAEQDAIGKAAAENFAFADAGVDPAEATIKQTKFEHEDGQYVYEVEFYANGVEYDYLVRADDGRILKRDVDGTPQQSASSTAETAVSQMPETQATEAAVGQSSDVAEPSGQPAQNAGVQTGITLDEAKEKGLEDAGIEAADVTFVQAYLDYEDGVAVYEVEFYAGGQEYDYEIHADTGAVVSRKMEVLPDGAAAATGGASYLDVDQAKANAANHAGAAEEDVSFSKAKLENDDGRTVYEVEFFFNGAEYEYVIDAYTGQILEVEMG